MLNANITNAMILISFFLFLYSMLKPDPDLTSQISTLTFFFLEILTCYGSDLSLNTELKPTRTPESATLDLKVTNGLEKTLTGL